MNTWLDTVAIIIVYVGTAHQTEIIRVFEILFVCDIHKFVSLEEDLDWFLSLMCARGLSQVVVFVELWMGFDKVEGPFARGVIGTKNQSTELLLVNGASFKGFGEWLEICLSVGNKTLFKEIKSVHWGAGDI